MTHLPYILAAYSASAVTLIGIAAWVLADLREQKRKLRQLEDEGLRRRTGGGALTDGLRGRSGQISNV